MDICYDCGMAQVQLVPHVANVLLYLRGYRFYNCSADCESTGVASHRVSVQLILALGSAFIFELRKM